MSRSVIAVVYPDVEREGPKTTRPTLTIAFLDSDTGLANVPPSITRNWITKMAPAVRRSNTTILLAFGVRGIRHPPFSGRSRSVHDHEIGQDDEQRNLAHDCHELDGTGEEMVDQEREE